MILSLLAIIVAPGTSFADPGEIFEHCGFFKTKTGFAVILIKKIENDAPVYTDVELCNAYPVPVLYRKTRYSCGAVFRVEGGPPINVIYVPAENNGANDQILIEHYGVQGEATKITNAVPVVYKRNYGPAIIEVVFLNSGRKLTDKRRKKLESGFVEIDGKQAKVEARLFSWSPVCRRGVTGPPTVSVPATIPLKADPGK